MSRKDHAYIAADLLRCARPWLSSAGRSDLGQVASILAAHAEATLALVEQQRIANLIALTGCRYGFSVDGFDGLATTVVHDDGPKTHIRPDIAAALGIEVEQ